MRHSITRYALAAALGLSGAFAQAQVVYDNGGPDHASGNNMGFAMQAEDFTLAAATTLGTVQFWSLEGAAVYRNQISFQIRADNAGTPGAVLLDSSTASVARTALGSVLGLTEFDNSFALPTPLALGAGHYWLVLHNGSMAEFGDPNEFLWETTAGLPAQTGGYEAFAAAGPFTPNFQEHAFNLSAVPEPAQGVALLAGLAVLFGVSRRTRNRTFEQ